MGQIGSRMPRKLKTYVTNLGFFELALAAPSMKAALEAWGMGHNAFHQGFAKETDDPKIVAATMAQPGVVLKRPVGTKGPFTENAALPKGPWTLTAPKAASPPKPNTKVKAKSTTGADSERDKAAILSFQKAKEQRDRERERTEAAEAARQEKEQGHIARAVAKAEEALQAAQARHEEAMKAIETERDKLDHRATAENQRWNAERKKLQAAALQAAKR